MAYLGVAEQIRNARSGGRPSRLIIEGIADLEHAPGSRYAAIPNAGLVARHTQARHDQ